MTNVVVPSTNVVVPSGPAPAAPVGLLTPGNRDAAVRLLSSLVELGVDFKLGEDIYGARLSPVQLRDRICTGLPEYGAPVEQVMEEFVRTLLPYCKNEASPRFLGFGDTGADLAALGGGVLALLTQQNLINQSFDSPSATFAEIAVLRWLRELIGYTNPAVGEVTTVWDTGGIVTTGGTMSNTVAMMLAREHAVPATMRTGVREPERYAVVVPAGIGHYSVTSAVAWIGCGMRQVIEVPTAGYRYDLAALERTLRAHPGRVMAVVAYAGDSRTQTLEDLRGVLETVRGADEGIWLHADACWGLMAALTPRLAHRLEGITGFDSVTVDPHKILDVPYNLSALLVRHPQALRSIASHSDLIMQEDFAFGQVTPFLGSKGWSSLKLWAALRAHGRTGLAALVDRRRERTAAFCALVDSHPRLLRLHDPDMTAVAFVYLPAGFDAAAPDIELLNRVNTAIHAELLEEGRWFFHQFSLRDAGRIQADAVLHPLRFVGCNPRIEAAHMTAALEHVVELGLNLESRPAAGDRR